MENKQMRVLCSGGCWRIIPVNEAIFTPFGFGFGSGRDIRFYCEDCLKKYEPKCKFDVLTPKGN